jgi:putative phosphoribosyl transferase
MAMSRIQSGGYPGVVVFADRRDAGVRLAARLTDFRGQHVLVLGIPRGGVPVAAEVAFRLGAELDVVVARKVGAPGFAELAIGAVTANGGHFMTEEMIEQLGVSDTYLEMAVAREMAEARRREERFRAGRSLSRLEERVVLLVDDGLATGATMRAAVRSVRSHHPSKLVVAVPVGSIQACAALRPEVDELVCLEEPEPFDAVGLYHEDFEPIEDAEVQRFLQEAWARSPRLREDLVAHQ